MKTTNENPDHTVWEVEVNECAVFNTKEEAQKYADKMNKENVFKVKELDIHEQFLGAVKYTLEQLNIR